MSTWYISKWETYRTIVSSVKEVRNDFNLFAVA